jgi:hypothetical protein
MYNLYSITTNQAAIIALFRAATLGTSRRCPACFPTIQRLSCATQTPGAS